MPGTKTSITCGYMARCVLDDMMIIIMMMMMMISFHLTRSCSCTHVAAPVLSPNYNVFLLSDHNLLAVSTVDGQWRIPTVGGRALLVVRIERRVGDECG